MAVAHYRVIKSGKHKDAHAGESGCLKFPGIRDPKRVLDSTPGPRSNCSNWSALNLTVIEPIIKNSETQPA